MGVGPGWGENLRIQEEYWSFFWGGNSRMSGKPLEFWEHPRDPNSSSVVHRPIASALLRKLLEMQNPGHAPKCQASIYHTTKSPRDEQHNEV